MNLTYAGTADTEIEKGHRAIFLEGDGKRYALSTLDHFELFPGIVGTETVFIEIGEDDMPVENGLEVTLDDVGDFDEAVEKLALVISSLPEKGTLKHLFDKEPIIELPEGATGIAKGYLNYKGEVWVASCTKNLPDPRTGERGDSTLFSLSNPLGTIASERENEYLFVEGVGDPEAALAILGYKVA